LAGLSERMSHRDRGPGSDASGGGVGADHEGSEERGLTRTIASFGRGSVPIAGVISGVVVAPETHWGLEFSVKQNPQGMACVTKKNVSDDPLKCATCVGPGHARPQPTSVGLAPEAQQSRAQRKRYRIKQRRPVNFYPILAFNRV
jgi:hypothetical protein